MILQWPIYDIKMESYFIFMDDGIEIVSPDLIKFSSDNLFLILILLITSFIARLGAFSLAIEKSVSPDLMV